MVKLVGFLQLGLAVAVSLPTAGQEPPRPAFELVAERRDLNGLMLNPSWRDSSRLPSSLDPERTCGILALHGASGYRRVLLRSRDCFGEVQSSILRLNEPQAVKIGGFICAQTSEDGSVHGHVNWFPVTLTGSLRFEKVMGGEGGDYDVNFNLLSTDRWPVTRWNWRHAGHDAGSQIHLEFDYRETIGRLPQAPVTWWTSFRELADSSTKEEVDTFLGRGRRSAVVTGLFGLDDVHNGHAEIHPVYAIGFVTGADTVGQQELRQQWAFLARDRGNEGNCASGTLPFRLGAATDTVNEYRFLIETPEGATGVPRIERDSSWIGVTGPVVGSGLRFYYAAKQGLEVAVRWPAPRRGSGDAMMIGVITVSWRGQFVPKSGPGARPQAITPLSLLGPERDDVNQPGAGAVAEGCCWGPVRTDTTWDDTVVRVDSLPHADPVPPSATEVFDALPPVVHCGQVPKSWNPRCLGEWSLSPFGGFHLFGSALNRTGAVAVVGIGLESLRMDPFPDLLGRNLHLRPGFVFVWRRPPSDPQQIQFRGSVQLGTLLGPFTWSHAVYFVVNPEFGWSNNHRWVSPSGELSIGPGIRVINGHRVDLAIELLGWVSKASRPYYVAALRVPFVAW